MAGGGDASGVRTEREDEFGRAAGEDDLRGGGDGHAAGFIDRDLAGQRADAVAVSARRRGQQQRTEKKQKDPPHETKLLLSWDNLIFD